MFKILKQKFNLGWIVNPFFAYCFAFVFSLSIYILGWSSIYPELTASILIFFLLSFIPFIICGLYIKKNTSFTLQDYSIKPLMFDLPFCILLCLGILICILEGYVPLFREDYNYKKFGLPIFDTLFYSLSIYLSIFYFSSYLALKSKKLLVYLVVIIVFQILLYNRYTLLWIFVSSAFVLIIFIKKITASYVLVIGIVLFLISSFCFGLFGNLRSNFSKDYVLTELHASSKFMDLNLSHNYYITYLYISSPIANLQKNLNGIDQIRNRDFKNFLFYSIFPVSLTKRIEEPLNMSIPEYNLIIPSLTAGTYFMNGCFSLGWLGMALLAIFAIIYIIAALSVIPHNSPFYIISFVLITTTASLLIFDNFLIRMDIILILFIYPFIFHHLNLKFLKNR